MKWRAAIVLAVVLGLAAILGTREVKAMPQDSLVKPCVVNVPQVWGEFRGISKFGLVFEDSDHTLRIIDQMPCSDEHLSPNATPRISVEIRRR